MDFVIAKIRDRSDELVKELVFIWEESVKASHNFLKPDDISVYKQFVVEGVKGVEHLLCLRLKNRNIGFAGINGTHLEMLFLHPDYFGVGAGCRFMEVLLDEYQIASLDVNEQNERARAFYERAGFEVISRKDIDDFGKPYAILTMKLVK